MRAGWKVCGLMYHDFHTHHPVRVTGHHSPGTLDSLIFFPKWFSVYCDAFFQVPRSKILVFPLLPLFFLYQPVSKTFILSWEHFSPLFSLHWSSVGIILILDYCVTDCFSCSSIASLWSTQIFFNIILAREYLISYCFTWKNAESLSSSPGAILCPQYFTHFIYCCSPLSLSCHLTPLCSPPSHAAFFSHMTSDMELFLLLPCKEFMPTASLLTSLDSFWSPFISSEIPCQVSQLYLGDVL